MGGGIGWAEKGRKLLISHYKPWVLFKLCACITLGKIKINFKNPERNLVNDTHVSPCFTKFGGIRRGYSVIMQWIQRFLLHPPPSFSSHWK